MHLGIYKYKLIKYLILNNTTKESEFQIKIFFSSFFFYIFPDIL